MAVDFLELLRRSEIMSPEDIATTVRQEHLTADQDPKELAKAFVKGRQITLFQANHLLHGHSRGLLIDEYKLREILGTGGMGWVYIAEPKSAPTGHSQLFAIKVLSDRIKHDAGIRARFELEAKAGIQLNHPNIVRTLKYGLTHDLYGEVPFMVMEYVEGINLQDLMRLKQGPLEWHQAVDCIRQAALGLQHAHEHGMVHRDIKPTNLLITKSGNVKILDFGLALLTDDSQAEFSLAMIFGHQCLGTDDYISPEQTFNSHTVDGRADIYSLGCTFYQVLTNSVPYPLPRTPQKIDAHRRLPFPDIRQKLPQLPAEVAQILGKMVAKSPEERFASCAEVADALAPYSKSQAIEFDFTEILKIRALEARKRLQAAHPSSRANSSSAELKPSAPAMSVQPQANLETRIATDTTTQGTATPANPKQKSTEASKPKPVALNVAMPEGIAASADAMRLRASVDGAVTPLNRPRILIGRGTDADIPLNSQKVSARHAELIMEGQFWRIRDLHSRKGIKVNGLPATDQMLWPGDRITIAETFEFVFEENQPVKSKSWWLEGLISVSVVFVLLVVAYLLGWLKF